MGIAYHKDGTLPRVAISIAFQGAIMRLSQTGLTLCGVYAFASVVIWIYTNNMAGDFKGKFVLMQLPIVFAHALAFEFGLLPFLEQMPEIIVWNLLFITTLTIVYCVGWSLGRLASTC